VIDLGVARRALGARHWMTASWHKVKEQNLIRASFTLGANNEVIFLWSSLSQKGNFFLKVKTYLRPASA
jgi:poly(A) polymerase Pap1